MKSNRRQFIKTTVSGIAALCVSNLFFCKKRMDRPNIIFIFSDDLSYKDLSCYGQRYFQTPNLDKLALDGIRFNQAYSGAPECAPARASLMTGKHLGHCRIRKNQSVRGQDHLLAEDITVAEVLKAGGYVSGFIGKWGIGLPNTPGVPYKQGFDYAYGFYDQARAHTYYPDFLMENEKVIPLPENFGFNMPRVYDYNRRPINNLLGVENYYDSSGKLVPDGVKDPKKAKHSENLMLQSALRFIDKNKDNPFFLYYATQLPHGPCITPDLGNFKDKNWRLKNKEWAAMVTHMDKSVGRLLEQLEKHAIRKNTVIFFAGDNGYSQWGYFGRPKWEDDPLFENKGQWKGGKFFANEGGLRVPFFVNWPGKIKPRVSDHICALYDFFATAADLAGLVAPPNDGISLLAEMKNDPFNQKKHDYLYWENSHEQAVRLGPWHAYREHPAKSLELYEIEKDPACKIDLAFENPEIVRRVEEIFNQAHSESKWYCNPGDIAEQLAAKRQEALELKQVQTPTRANTTFTKRR